MRAEVVVDERALLVWPPTQTIQKLDAVVYATRFADTDAYHPRLIATILARAAVGEAKYYAPGAGGIKVHHVDRWACPAAELMHERAHAFYRHALKRTQAVADISWANVSRRGDYCLPHSHVRATASIVYFVDPGDPDPTDLDAGHFAFVDPRLAPCCPQQEACMTRPMYPRMEPGTMLIFPGALVHAVNPYRGERPRVTMSWNLNDNTLSGEALPPLR